MSSTVTVTTALATLGLALGALLAAPVDADARVLIAQRQVGDGADLDVIDLPGPARFVALQFCAEGRAIGLGDIDVRYGNGGHDDLPVRYLIEPGTCTRAIDLRGRARDVVRIVLKYTSIAKVGPQPVMSVYGY